VPAGTVTVAVPAPWTVTCAVVLSVWPAALIDMFSVDCDGLREAIPCSSITDAARYWIVRV